MVTGLIFQLLEWLLPVSRQHFLAISLATYLAPMSEFSERICIVATYFFPEYRESACVEPNNWDNVHRESDVHLEYPKGKAPFPAVLLLHGSSDALSESMIRRKKEFLSAGYAVMIVNSFTDDRYLEHCFRGVSPCDYMPRNRERLISEVLPVCPASLDKQAHMALHQGYIDRVAVGHALLPWERAADFYAALKQLKNDTSIQADNIHVAAYSHGGSTFLDAITIAYNNLILPGFDALQDNSLAGIRSAAVYYPNCAPGTYFHWFQSTPLQLPVLIILASDDGVVKPEECEQAVSRMNSRTGSASYTLKWFDNRHGFDMVEYPDAFDPVSQKAATEVTLAFIDAYRINDSPFSFSSYLSSWRFSTDTEKKDDTPENPTPSGKLH